MVKRPEQKLLGYAVAELGREVVAERLRVRASMVDRVLAGELALAPRASLILADLVIALSKSPQRSE